MAIGASFVVGTTVHNVFIYAQNTTTTYAPVVQSSDALLASVIAAIIAVAGLIKTFVDRGWLDKRVGTVAVMASDAAVAVKDNRQTIKDLAQNTYDVVKITNPETAAAADQKLAPVLDQATVRINEYIPKVEKFTALGNKLSNGGTKADPKIEEMKDEIPDKIVPS
jgi:hypothetical protein